MSALLLLNLRAADDGEWLLWDSETERVRDRGTLSDATSVETLRAHSRESACYVLVPGEYVVQLSVTLPVAGSAAQAALPYQVEEKLSSDLSLVHLTHERIRANEPCRVWVVARSHMEDWQLWLQASGIKVRLVMPDYAMLGDHVAVQSGERVIGQLATRAATLESDLFSHWLSLNTANDNDVGELRLVIVGDGEAVVDAAHVERADCQLEAVARYFRRPGSTLCQGHYALHDPLGDGLRLLRWPALAAGFVILLHWLLLAVSAMQYSQRADQLDTAIDEVYRGAFPDAKRIVNARSQMKSQLNALQGRSGDAGVLPLLAPVAKAFKGESDITVTQLVYQNQSNALRLAIDAKNYAAIDAFSNRLQAQTLQVSRGTFRQNGELVSGQLIVTREGAE